MSGSSERMCDVMCITHNEKCCCCCVTPHPIRKDKDNKIVNTGCYKQNPFDEEKSLHYHENCYFDDDGLSLTENTMPLTREEICSFCNIETNNIQKHIKDNHGWFVK